MNPQPVIEVYTPDRARKTEAIGKNGIVYATKQTAHAVKYGITDAFMFLYNAHNQAEDPEMLDGLVSLVNGLHDYQYPNSENEFQSETFTYECDNKDTNKRLYKVGNRTFHDCGIFCLYCLRITPHTIILLEGGLHKSEKPHQLDATMAPIRQRCVEIDNKIQEGLDNNKFQIRNNKAGLFLIGEKEPLKTITIDW